jgi:hypothetical protein
MPTLAVGMWETPGMDTSTPLVPEPRVTLRASLLVGMASLVLIAPCPWSVKVVSLVTMAAILGTYPRSTINAKYFEKRWFVLFRSVGSSRTRLADVIQIETDLERRLGLLGGGILSVLVGLWTVLMVWMLDWLVPWAGGDYMIWLRTYKDQRVLAWQGFGEDNFRRNLEILEEISGQPVTRG